LFDRDSGLFVLRSQAGTPKNHRSLAADTPSQIRFRNLAIPCL
jgi:hypothetical protein